MLRLATAQDQDPLLALQSQKAYPPLPVRAQDSQARRAYYRKVYHQLFESALPHPEFDILVLEEGDRVLAYATLLKSQPEGLSGLTQSLLFDHYAPDRMLASLVAGARDWAQRNYQTHHLTVEIYPGQSGETEVLASLGFQPETHRIAVRTALWTAPPDYPYQVRLARPSDSTFLAYLNSVSLPFVLPAGREHDLDRIAAQSMSVYSNLLRKNDPGDLILILTEKRRQIGYLILKLGTDGQDPLSTPLAYVYDLAIERAHWGRRGVLQIMRTGSNLLFERGIPLLVGDISASNPRALKTAQRNLGFAIEWTRHGISLQK